MGLPGHRRTSSHKRRRASHFALGKKTLSQCPKCHEAVLPHRACANCGTYKGRQVLNVTRDVTRTLKRKQAKSGAAAKAAESAHDKSSKKS